MCFPNARITADAGGKRQGISQDGPSEAELADPDRISEEADAVGRPDSEKGVQSLEDYYKRRKRLRLLAIEMAKRGAGEGGGFGLRHQSNWGGGSGGGGGGEGGGRGLGGGG